MGITLMADDLSLIVGEIRGATKALTERLDRQDAETIRANEQRERDKQEAIAARDAKHDENKADIRLLRETMDGTAQLARDNARWIDQEGKALITRVDNIHDRVTAIEDGRRISEAEERGSGKTWALIGGGVVTGGGMLTGVIGYWREIVDFIKGIGHGG